MFVTAGFFFALVLVGLPLWLHRLRRFEGERRQFASLRLMEAEDDAPRSRPRLHHLLLLALRLLLIVVAVLAFARPVLEREQVFDGSGVARLIVVDVSHSMSADDLITQAKDAAARLADSATGPVSLALADAAGLSLLVQDGTAGEIRQALSRIVAGDTMLGFASLTARIGSLVQVWEGAPEVHLISDFQQQAMPDRFNDLVNSGNWSLVLHPVKAADTGNVALESVTVSGRGNTANVQVTVRRFGAGPDTLNVSVSGGEFRATLPVAFDGAGVATASVEMTPVPSVVTAHLGTGGALAGDDTRRVANRSAAQSATVLGEGEAGYLLAALEANGQAGVRQVTPDVSKVPDGSALIALDPHPGWPAQTLREIRDRVRAGASLFVTAGPAMRRAGELVFPQVAVTARRIADSRSPVLAVDLTHPLLAGLVSSLDTEVYQQVAPRADWGGRTILATEAGDPVLVEYPLGAGRVLVLLTALDPAWSSLVVDPAFVSLVSNLQGYLAGGVLPRAVDAGAPLTISGAALQIFDAQGRRMLELAQTTGRQTVRLKRAGFYEVHTAGRVAPLAVNVPVAESDLTPAPEALLRRWAAAQSGRSDPAQVSAASEQQGLLAFGPLLLAILAILGLGEAVWANVAGRAGLTGNWVDNSLSSPGGAASP